MKTIVTTLDEQILSNNEDLSRNNLSPCNHGKGDYRTMLHALHMSRNRLQRVTVNTSDTDVVVIAVSTFQQLDLVELWIRLGTGKHTRFIPIHEIVQNIGLEMSRCLQAFHALTGCDQTSFMFTCGKKKAWKTWMKFPNLTDAPLKLIQEPQQQNC